MEFDGETCPLVHLQFRGDVRELFRGEFLAFGPRTAVERDVPADDTD